MRVRKPLPGIVICVALIVGCGSNSPMEPQGLGRILMNNDASFLLDRVANGYTPVGEWRLDEPIQMHKPGDVKDTAGDLHGQDRSTRPRSTITHCPRRKSTRIT